MKKAICLVVLMLGVLIGQQQAGAITIFTATLTGAQEVPPNASAATGTATLTLNNAMDRLEIMVQLVGLDLLAMGTMPTDPNDVQAFHIHAAPAGTNGSVVFGFISPNSDLNGDLVIDPVAETLFTAWDLNEGNGGQTLASQLGNLFSAGLYLNAHTPTFPGGEIRGQIIFQQQIPEPESTALL
nr:CHRD domain-containing protein [Pseudomonadota bacterium]